jgi:hypothetical protein
MKIISGSAVAPYHHMESLYPALIASVLVTILVGILFECGTSLSHGEDEL